MMDFVEQVRARISPNNPISTEQLLLELDMLVSYVRSSDATRLGLCGQHRTEYSATSGEYREAQCLICLAEKEKRLRTSIAAVIECLATIRRVEQHLVRLNPNDLGTLPGDVMKNLDAAHKKADRLIELTKG